MAVHDVALVGTWWACHETASRRLHFSSTYDCRYLVSYRAQSEKVSAAKKIVLYTSVTDAVVEDSAARAALKLPSGDVTLSPTIVPAGSRLFVQSTSSNRKITAGVSFLVPVAHTLPAPSPRITLIGAGSDVGPGNGHQATLFLCPRCLRDV